MKINKFVLIVFACSVLNQIFVPYAKAGAHPAGTNVASNGTIFMVTDDGYRRPYTSAGAFLSYGFNSWADVQQATAEDLALPQGSFIPPRNGKIVCSDRGTDKGTCYLVTNGKRAAFVSAKVFTDLGFRFDEAVFGDVSFLNTDVDITNATDQHRAGVLINKSGTIYLISPRGLLGVPSMSVLQTWGYSLTDAVIANPADEKLAQVAITPVRAGSQLEPEVSASDTPSTVLSPVVPQPANNQANILVSDYLNKCGALIPTTTVDSYQTLPAPAAINRYLESNAQEIIREIKSLAGHPWADVYPNVSQKSLEVLNGVPNLKSCLENSTGKPIYLSGEIGAMQIYAGGFTGLYTERQFSNASSTIVNSLVFQFEGNVWKWDIVGTYKYLLQNNQTNFNPNTFTSGSGVNDIAIKDAYFTTDITVGNPDIRLMVFLKNDGQTTINKFNLSIHVNDGVNKDAELLNKTLIYSLAPQQSVLLFIPINGYWSLSNVLQNPNYYTDIVTGVGFDKNIGDGNIFDNTLDIKMRFY